MKFFRKQLLIIITSFFLIQFSNAQGDTLFWPKEINTKSGFVTTLYQPQLDHFKDNILEARMAVTIQPPAKEMIFGAVWFKAVMATDLENRTIRLQRMNIEKTHFPDIIKEDTLKKFSELLSNEMESWELEMSLDRFIASLEEVEDLKKLSDNLNNDPPKIYFRTHPAVLVQIDGDPILKKEEQTGMEYVVNTPFFIAQDKSNHLFYINGGPFWYSSDSILGNWKSTTEIPLNISKFAELYNQNQEIDSVDASSNTPPELIITTERSELITVDGEMDYKAIEGTNLLYVENTEFDIIMDIETQFHYILFSGRWFYSRSLKDGAWKYKDPNFLPQEFKKIPEDAAVSSVRSSIPGTSEAESAVMEQSIPQTATVNRNEATVTVDYDGEPQFEKIENTDVSYALNTNKTVLLIHTKYYCVDDAIWFVSESAKGPWEVSTSKPEEVNQIPPDAPCYNVKYTYVYDSTEEEVEVGYLPGYTHSYTSNGVVVYGTGYYYTPWYYTYYYPYPVTYGYGAHYNPWTGWGYSACYSSGWISWSFHVHYGWWGPRGYHRGYRHGYHRGYRRGYRAGYRAGHHSARRNTHRNVYNNRSRGVKNTNAYSNNRTNKTTHNANKKNNYYTDKKGNVYQRNQKGNFDKKSNAPTRSNAQKPANAQQPSNRSSLERSHQNRNRGTQNYNRTHQQQRGGTRPSGGHRSGGGGRRGR